MKFRYWLTFTLFLANLLPAEAGEQLHKSVNWIPTESVILQGLDKVSARVFTAEISVDQKVHFGSLEIYVRSANRSPPEDQPESICFVEIFDNKPGQQRQQVFSGWMFASNPSLSALEHPVYDIWVKEAMVSEEVLKARQKAEEDLIENSSLPTSDQNPDDSKEKTPIVEKEEKKKEDTSLNPDDDDSDDDSGGF